jgi:hypothetical protein
MRRRAHYHGRGGRRADVVPTPAFLGKMADTPQPCSCYACRSPRYVFKSPKWRLTVQEQRAALAEIE